MYGWSHLFSHVVHQEVRYLLAGQPGWCGRVLQVRLVSHGLSESSCQVVCKGYSEFSP